MLLTPKPLDIAQKAVKRAIAAGFKSPLFYFADPPTSSPGAWTFNGEDDYARFVEVTLLGALAGSFDPIDVREHHERVKKEYKTLSSIGLALPQGFKGDENQILKSVQAIEAGRRVAKGKSETTFISPISFCFCVILTRYLQISVLPILKECRLSMLPNTFKNPPSKMSTISKSALSKTLTPSRRNILWLMLLLELAWQV